jgi:arylsulfatase
MSSEEDLKKHPSQNSSQRGIARRDLLLGTSILVAAATLTSSALAQAQPAVPAAALVASAGRKPNILVIFGDDIGQTNVSAYSFGLMGYRTPNIDRIAREGMMFTDYYAEQSCTAGRSSFITGQCTLRTGLSKVGIPGATVGLQDRDVTIAQLLKPLGYATGQFGKNHLGDRNEYLPTVHGFDEFFGNLYHLNAEEDPENWFYPRDPGFREKFGPRGVLRCKASDRDDPTEHPRFGRVGKQTIEDTGPLTRKRMETIETSAAAIDFHPAAGASKHTVLLLVQLDPHAFPHPCAGGASRQARPELQDRICRRHDRARCDDSVPERKKHQLGGRIPCPLPDPLAPPHSGGFDLERDDQRSRLDADLARGGRRARCQGEAAYRSFKVHLDGYNQLPYLTAQQPNSARKEFVYFNDDGDFVALRVENWKIVFEEQRAPGTLRIWAEPFTKLRVPKFFNLRSDPYERADITSNTYYDWLMSDAAGAIVAAPAVVAKFLATFKDYPPSQRPSSFSIDQIVEKMQRSFEASQSN